MTAPDLAAELEIDHELVATCAAAVNSEFVSRVAELGIAADLTGAYERVYVPLALWIDCQRVPDRTTIVGLNGAQGSGKSTLSDFLALILRQGLGRNVARLSIDDLYFPQRVRRRLAAEIHPLFRTRGVPGTHEVSLGLSLLEDLCKATSSTATPLPTFDKATDDRLPASHWQAHRGRPDVVLFEGWCVGLRAQPERDLSEPVNDLERFEDTQGVWRRTVNDRLHGDYRQLFERLDLLLMLCVPSLTKVVEWRNLQERKLASASPASRKLMSPSQISDFVMHYERLTRWALTDLPERADLSLDVDEDHQISGIRWPADAPTRS